MSKQHPDHHDAELMLKCYDLRREELMRKSRDTISNFYPKNYEEVVAVMNPQHPMNAAFRQVASYWEMVFGMIKHGIVHPEFFTESNAEGLFVYTKVEPYIEQLRKDFSPYVLQNAEWVAKNTATGKAYVDRIKAYIQKMAEATAK